MLDIQTISKRLGAFEIRNFDLQVREGEYFVHLGPSGVGKTVLIEMIAGLLRPDTGRILWKGRDVTHLPPEQRRFSMVYQDYALFPQMTVAQNIAYGLRASGMKSGPARDQVRAMAQKLHIESLLDHRPETLSGGEQQRVALARALVRRPALLLLDEPLSAVDMNTRREMRHLLGSIHSETGTTFFHVTHDLEDAMALGHQIGVMIEGRVLQVGSPEELFRRPSNRQVAEFLGMQNILRVNSVKDHVCEIDGTSIHVTSANESVSHLWIKPEEILLSREPFDSSARNQFRARVVGWEPSHSLLMVRVQVQRLGLSVLITHHSFAQLKINIDSQCVVTFKSSAVHCF